MEFKLLTKKLFFAALLVGALPASSQVDVNYRKYPDYSSEVKGDAKLMMRRTDAAAKRPSRVNNAETKFFPTVFNQDGGSCGSASRISYMFTYEINALRNADAANQENVYPSHFTWLLTNSNSSKDGMAIANGIPNVPTYGGRTYSNLFGNQDCADSDFGWMQGYDKWYSAMFNRLERTANFPMSVESEEGREAVKNWLWNHNGDPDFAAGGVCGIGVASAGTWLNIPKTAVNDEIGVTGKYYVGAWGSQVDHALTIVGYDDLIEFDLDGNGVAGEVDKDEVGAWIVANSWGSSWCNSGFIYCPYKNAVTVGNGTDYYWPEVYYIRKNYRPLRTLKITMEHNKRSEILLSAGVSSDINSDTPERTVQFEHFKYAGDGDGDGTDATCPMLGRWKDGLNYEPMEFGYDLTDLSLGFDTRRPLKYFFIVESKSTSIGSGKIHACSLMDYEIDSAGIEFPFDIDDAGVMVQNRGKQTVISVVVSGEPLYAPRNFVIADGMLAWDAPETSTYELVGYNIYSSGSIAARVSADEKSFPADGLESIDITAVYKHGNNELESSKVSAVSSQFYGTKPESNVIRGIMNSGFSVDNLFDEKLQNATIEFWFKPTNCIDWNQQIGAGWGKFLMHTTSTRQLVVGWDTGNRITSAAGTFTLRKWHHVAVVVNGNTMTAYVNGEKVGEITSGQNGVGGFGSLAVGSTSASTAINGNMDEFRVWNTARTQRQIQSLMYSQIADPVNTPGLLVEVTMDQDDNGAIYDATGKHGITVFGGTQRVGTDNTVMSDNRELSASFSLPEAPYYAGTSIVIENTSSANVVRNEWNIDGKTYLVENPELIFDTEGEKNITLTVYDAEGNSLQCEQSITVEALPVPVASFECNDMVLVGDRISFVNTTTPMNGCRFEWVLTGADVDTVTTVNAAASYGNSGEYIVTLNAENAFGKSSVSKTIHVQGIVPDVDFTVSPAAIIKGNKVKLVDASLYDPVSWRWTVVDAYHHYVYNGAECEFVMDNPGVYDVTLDATNIEGSGTETRKGAIVVCNADSKSGLNFTGEEKVAFKTPVDVSLNNAFTIDWWMNPKRFATYSHAIGGSESDLLIRSLADGTLSFTMGGSTYVSGSGFFKAGEWHHYAVVFNFGDVYLYRDCNLEAVLYTRFVGTAPAMPTIMRLGGDNGAMNAMIDEFRVWNTALDKDVLRSYANAPIEDVAAAEAAHKLALYYQFNQNAGSVVDATSNKRNGTRTGFGPAGDAWGSSLGVFCLSEAAREDVTASYLTNYQMPFLHSDNMVNSAENGRYMELLQGVSESTWVLQNPTVSGNVVTGWHVDTAEGNVLSLMMKNAGFESSVSNHKLFQTLTLPAGHYVFGIKEQAAVSDYESYVVVSEGAGLPDTDDLLNGCIAWALLSDKEVEFTLTAETEVSLGLLLNTRGECNMQIAAFFLEKKLSNDDFSWVGVECIKENEVRNNVTVNVYSDCVKIATVKPRRVDIYSVTGVLVYGEYVDGEAVVSLPKGMYVIDGCKFFVR